MDRKLVFLDVDGTLTEPGRNQPPLSAQRAVRRARANGHRVVLCSGRNAGMLESLLRYGFDGMIASAGGYVEYGGQIVYDCPMTPAQQQRAMDVFAECGIHRMIEGRRYSYSDAGFQEYLCQSFMGELYGSRQHRGQRYEQPWNVRPMTEYRGEAVYKLLFACPNVLQLEKPIQVLEDEFDFSVREAGADGMFSGEIVSKSFNKGLAVRMLCDFLGVSLADTVAYGDSMNDLEMIQTVGLGICMGNGSRLLKRYAKAICPPVAEDGLHKSFAQYGLI